MCGFFQVFQRHESIPPERFKDAFQGMRHRGPDDTGVRFDTFQPISQAASSAIHMASGHHRLSILDLDERSNQPFVHQQSTLLYNGEIYNFKKLRSELESEGPAFATQSDTEVLLRGLEARGLPFLDHCNGMWAFTHFNAENGLLTAARDRYGKKPLFYFQDETHLCLSSTIQPICAYLGMKQRMRDEMVESYLLFGQMFPPPGHATHLHDIFQVEPGGVVEFDLHEWTQRRRRYFTLESQLPSDPKTLPSLPDLARDAVVSRLVSDRKVGLMLSGGVDSTLILSILHASGYQKQVHCFIGETGRSEDAHYGAECTKALGIEARLVKLDYGRNTFERMLKLCRHQEKPFPFLGSTMAMSEMYEAIAEHDVRVVLDGTGGDELFGGYWERQFPIALREALTGGDWPWLREAWRRTPGTPGMMMTVLKDMALHNRILDLKPRFLRKRYAPAPLILGLHRSRQPPSDPFWAPPHTFQEALVRDAQPGGRLGEWIWHNDRNAMMSGIENRSPLLDYRFIPFMASGYASKFKQQWNKHQLRSLFDAFSRLPTQWRQQKQGFRWDRKAFLRQNQDRILDLIAASEYLTHRFKTRSFVDKARKNRRLLYSSATLRLLCLAGIESELGLASN